jgi:hypothetical protein
MSTSAQPLRQRYLLRVIACAVDLSLDTGEEALVAKASAEFG